MSIEESPEFQKALNEACEKQYRGYLFGGAYVKAASKDTVGETLEKIEAERKRLMEKHGEYMQQAELMREQARFMTNPHMREITETLRKKHGSGGLVCPVCGGGDDGNRMNGKPWCFECNVPLMTVEKAADWVKPEKPKPWSFTFNEPDGVVKKR